MRTGSIHACCACVLLAACGSTGPGHPPIGQPIGRVWPAHYCRGDVLDAEYSVFATDAPCDDVPGHACDAVTPPRVTETSSPEEFPPRSVTALSDHGRFMPSGDAVDVTFRVEPDPYGATYFARRADGTHRSVVRVLRSSTFEARRFTGGVDVDVEAPVVCADGHPAYGAGQVRWPDDYSYLMQPLRVCNLSSVPVRLSFNSPSGVTPEVSIGSGACTDTDTPEFNIPSALAVGVRTPALDPTATCSPLQGSPGVPVIKVRVTLGCPPG